MDSVLIISSSEKAKAFFREILNLNSCKEIVAVSSSSEARHFLDEKDFDLCIINVPLSDEFGVDLALDIVSRTMMQAMLIVKSEIVDEVSARVEDSGVIVMTKPIIRQVFENSLKMVTVFNNRMKRLKNENYKLHKKIDDIQFVNRAKCVLIEYLKMTESEAHRFIEKQSMDLRITAKEVATRILKTYES